MPTSAPTTDLDGASWIRRRHGCREKGAASQLQRPLTPRWRTRGN